MEQMAIESPIRPLDALNVANPTDECHQWPLVHI